MMYPRGLHKILLPDSNWLQEIIIGYALSGLKNVKRIYVHKKIHLSPLHQSEGEGVESDVSLITEDGKLIIIEVTRQNDLDNIIVIADRKIANLKKKNIPFNSICFVTSSVTSDHFIAMKDNAKIFLAHHLKDLPNFVEKEFLES